MQGVVCTHFAHNGIDHTIGLSQHRPWAKPSEQVSRVDLAGKCWFGTMRLRECRLSNVSL